MGKTNSTLVEKIARITAVEIRATGINWNFAPWYSDLPNRPDLSHSIFDPGDS